MSDHTEGTEKKLPNPEMQIPTWLKKFVIIPLLIPVLLVLYVLFLSLWLALTVTCIGPAIHAYLSRKEKKKFLSNAALQERVPDLNYVTCRGRQLAVRFTKPPPSTNKARTYPICIPNGMGATMAAIGGLHDALVEQGFTVLSYDRVGCGFSDVDVSGKQQSVLDTIQDMDSVMCTFLPADQQWILIGPSMGSIVGQCYVASYPHKVVGFLNMDGLPYPFHKKTKLFTRFGSIYWIESKLVWTGLFRPFIRMARSGLNKFASIYFPTDLLAAQANEANFYLNVWAEMKLMMDCCAFADAAWGKQSIFSLEPSVLHALIQAPGTRIGDEGEDGAWRDFVLTNKQAAAPADSPLLQATDEEDSVLAKAWRKMVVRVMSARSYDFPFPGSKYVYDQDMRDWAAAEHAKHALMAADGARDVFPKRTHMSMFFAHRTIVANAVQISDRLEAKLEHGRPAATGSPAGGGRVPQMAAAPAPTSAEVASDLRQQCEKGDESSH